MTCREILAQHPALAERSARSLQALERIRAEFNECESVRDENLSVFCAGSIARLEVGAHSDLDFFVLAERSTSLERHLFGLTLFGQLIAANARLGYPDISNDGEYLKLHFVDEMRDKMGLARDDGENLFTARMLMLLESKPLVNDGTYDRQLTEIVGHYFRDSKGKRSFRPLFLLNDLLRYWRTLCLNYETRRNDPSKPWRKKNINLKFSRMLTVFGTVLPLIAKPMASHDVFATCRSTPLQRMSDALDSLEDPTLSSEWPEILDIYEAFLQWKEDPNPEKFLNDGTHKTEVREKAERFSTFIFRALTHDRIPAEFRRYLVL